METGSLVSSSGTWYVPVLSQLQFSAFSLFLPLRILECRMPLRLDQAYILKYTALGHISASRTPPLLFATFFRRAHTHRSKQTFFLSLSIQRILEHDSTFDVNASHRSSENTSGHETIGIVAAWTWWTVVARRKRCGCGSWQFDVFHRRLIHLQSYR